MDRGKLASVKGFANENRLLAALLERGHNASKVDLPHSPYDLVVEMGLSKIIRLQVKTVSPEGRVSFTGGTRGGRDRKYLSNVKEYVHSPKTCDLIVGVDSHKKNGGLKEDFYFIPTSFVQRIGQKSISTNKIQSMKNNWDILESYKEKDNLAALMDLIK